eukprot:13216_1
MMSMKNNKRLCCAFMLLALLMVTIIFNINHINNLRYGDASLHDHIQGKYNFEVWLMTTIGFNTSYLLIQYFIEWYKNIGIKPSNFLLTINLNITVDNMDTFAELETFLFTANISKYSIMYELFNSQKRQRMERENLNTIPGTDYILACDVDEFQDWKHFGVDNIYDFIQTNLINKNKEYVWGYLADRFAENASLINPKSLYNTQNNYNTNSLLEQYPFICNFTAAIVHGSTSKVCLYKNIYHLNTGRHQLEERMIKYKGKTLNISKFRYKVNFDSNSFKKGESVLRFKDFVIPIYHFKWNNNVLKYLKTRVKNEKRQNFDYWKESQNAITWLEKNSGKINLLKLSQNKIKKKKKTKKRKKKKSKKNSHLVCSRETLKIWEP